MNVRTLEISFFVVLLGAVVFMSPSAPTGFSAFNLITNISADGVIQSEEGLVLSGSSGNFTTNLIGDGTMKHWTIVHLNESIPLCFHELSLTPDQDTYIKDDKEDKSFADSKTLHSKNKTSEMLSLIRFSQPQLPENSTFLEANITLNLKKTGDYLDIYKSSEQWDENATWNEKYPGTSWSLHQYNSSELFASITLEKKGEYVFNLTEDYSWVSGNGILIAAGEKETVIKSKESGDPPVLRIAYSDQCTSVRMQARYCDSQNCSAFAGPDGTGNSFYESSVFSLGNWSEYVQMIFYLSGSENYSPSVASASVDYENNIVEINYSSRMSGTILEADAISMSLQGTDLSGELAWSSMPATVNVSGNSSINVTLAEGNYTITISLNISGMYAEKSFDVESINISVQDQPANQSEDGQEELPSTAPQPQASSSGSAPPPAPSPRVSTGKILKPGTDNTFVFEKPEIPVKLVNPSVSKEVNVDIKISKPSVIPSSEGRSIFSYIEIENIAVENAINDAVIEFEVDKKWINENMKMSDEVVMLRFVKTPSSDGTSSGKWHELKTEPIREDAGKVYYRSVTPGFSTFAISFKKSGIHEPVAAEKKDIEFQEETVTETISFVKISESGLNPWILVVPLLAMSGALLHHKHLFSSRKSRSRS